MYRFCFAIFCAVLFTSANLLTEQPIPYLNMYLYALLLLAFYQALEYAETYFYTAPINKMMQRGNQKVQDDEKKFGLEDMFGGAAGGQANAMFGMLDMVMNNKIGG